MNRKAEEKTYKLDDNVSLKAAKAIVKYLPAIEAGDVGEMVCVGQGDVYADLTKPMESFHKSLYKYGWIVTDFDWGSYVEEADQYIKDPKRAASADVQTLRKLLTAYVRGDRFCTGLFLSVLKSGLMVVILNRIKSLIAEGAFPTSPNAKG